MGNALFFIVSGYTWAKIDEATNFLGWYKRKIERIWIPTIFTNIIYVFLLMNPKRYDLYQLFRVFIYPNKSWFCGAVLLYAIGYFVVVRKKNLNSLRVAAIMLSLFYMVGYLFFLDKSEYNLEGLVTGGICRFAHYAICMLAGYAIKIYNKDFKNERRKHFVTLGVIIFVCAYAGKYVMEKSLTLLHFQVIIQFMNLLVAVLIFSGLIYKEKNGEYIIGMKSFRKIVQIISQYSWELYLVQTLILPICSNYRFPYNLILALFLIVICAYILKAICEKFYKVVGMI